MTSQSTDTSMKTSKGAWLADKLFLGLGPKGYLKSLLTPFNVIAALILITVGWLLAEMARRRPARLPGAFLWVWGALLGASWLLKLFSPPSRW